MAEFKCDHLHLRSRDPERTVAFYADCLGAKVLDRVETPNGVRIITDLGGLTVFIEQVPNLTPAPPEPPFLGIEHIGLAVSGIDQLAADLKRKGVRFDTEPRDARPGVRIAFLRGPENVRIELIERSDG